MFTGIIDHCGEIVAIDSHENRATLQIRTEFSDLSLGESISVDGICLTVTSIQSDLFSCDLSKETLSKTIAECYREGDRVNLERALRPIDRLSGHFVSGHVDQILAVGAKQLENEFIEMEFHGLLPEHEAYVVPKGSITVNGVSLTINALLEEGFTVTLIPHTLSRTNLSHLQINDTVNVEFDLIAKLVANQIDMYFDQFDVEEVERHDTSIH